MIRDSRSEHVVRDEGSRAGPQQGGGRLQAQLWETWETWLWEVWMWEILAQN